MKKIHLRHLCALAALFSFSVAMAQGPNCSGTYYKNADGKKGKALKTALFNIIKSHTELSYAGLYECYKTTDVREDGKLWDMYSGTTNYTLGDDEDHSGGASFEGQMYNREHSFPKSWFSNGKPMYTDLMHVIPTDAYVNGRRGNLPYGETDNPTYQSQGGFSKVGKGASRIGYTGKVFEPNDEYKGDFARIYFYMATCYEDKIANWSGEMLAGNDYPAYKEWALTMLLRWAKEDPVSEKEIDRNNAVYTKQRNRNPFVDYPGLEQLIWGDSQTTAFSYDNYEDPTDIVVISEKIVGSPSDYNQLYDLSGRRLRHIPTRGVYVRGGRKYVVK